MKTKIERLHYANLWNSEFPLVVEQTINICQKHDMESMKLGKSYAELLSYRPQLNAMTVYIRKNAKLTAIGMLDSERDTLINGFVKTVKALETIDLPQIRPHVEVLNILLSNHKAQTIATANRASETERLNMLENAINLDMLAQQAITELKLQAITQRLFDTNREYEASFRGYIADKSIEEHPDIPTLRRECTKSLTQFFDAVQYCAYAVDGVDFTTLVNELNELNSYYRQQLKTRETRRKNGKDISTEQPITPLKS